MPLGLRIYDAPIVRVSSSNPRIDGLGRRGIDVAYRRFPGGHDQTSWSESLVDALPEIFPPASRHEARR